MITRLAVRGFKNLLDVELQLGPFTCIVGPNGAGKSNLFDALLFLRELCDRPLLEAATKVRGGDPLRNLFSPNSRTIEMEVEFLIPKEGNDELGQLARATSTFLRYTVAISYRETSHKTQRDSLSVESETLTYIQIGESEQRLGFPHKKEWRESVVQGARRVPYISTDREKGVVKLHQDRQSVQSRRGGRPWEFQLENLPRTVLSSATNAQENPTAVLARRALRNCTLLQLEPSALRSPDTFHDPDSISPVGRHLPTTLSRIAGERSAEQVYTQVSNQLAKLVEGVDTVSVETDEQKRRRTIILRDLLGNELPASSLSDGTLRFLALAILELDSQRSGVLCLEEPENGIHPQRLPYMLELLGHIAVDVNEEVDFDNPLNQVLMNTHSPLVVNLLPKESIVFARRRQHGLELLPMEKTWRSRIQGSVALGEVMAFLNPLGRNELGYTAAKNSVYKSLGSAEQLELNV